MSNKTVEKQDAHTKLSEAVETARTYAKEALERAFQQSAQNYIDAKKAEKVETDSVNATMTADASTLQTIGRVYYGISGGTTAVAAGAYSLGAAAGTTVGIAVGIVAAPLAIIASSVFIYKAHQWERSTVQNELIADLTRRLTQKAQEIKANVLENYDALAA